MLAVNKSRVEQALITLHLVTINGWKCYLALHVVWSSDSQPEKDAPTVTLLEGLTFYSLNQGSKHRVYCKLQII